MNKKGILGFISMIFLMSGCGGVDGKYKCNNGQFININSNGKYEASVWRKTYVGSWSEINDKTIQLEGLANSNGLFDIDGNAIKLRESLVHLECKK